MPITADLADRTVAGVRRFCESADVETDLLAGIAARIRPAVPWDTGVLFATDPATTLFTDAHVMGFDPETCTPWFHHELNVEDVNLFRDLAGSGRVAVLSRTLDDPSTSARHREVMRPLGLDAEVRMTADDAAGTWAALELHREAGSRDFDHDEAALLAALAPLVADGLRRQATERAALAGAGVDGPGLLLVAPDGTVRPGTEAGAQWLSLLTPRGSQNLHSSLLTLSALRDRPGGTARLRVRAADGRWVTLHASPMCVGEGEETVVIVEPSGPSEVADLLARAHGLSPREREVALGLARGESTEQLASSLFLSPHTVRDHLKAVFRKTGTSSRTELVSYLFNAWYAERLFGSTAHDEP
ncbi:MAG: hypothetical protein CMH83_01475 [Nocardioides sp.]|nr:hypothetical protein [Nocardioides sp.]